MSAPEFSNKPLVECAVTFFIKLVQDSQRSRWNVYAEHLEHITFLEIFTISKIIQLSKKSKKWII